MVNTTYINIVDNLNYAFSVKGDKYFPIADFRLDEFNHCSHFLDDINLSPNKKGDYILFKRRRKHCNTTDIRYIYKFIDLINILGLINLTKLVKKIYLL